MISPEKAELLKSIKQTPYGKVLEEYLLEKFDEIGNILDSKSWEETQGRKFALILLKDLFAFLEPKKPSEKKKNQYT